MAADFDSVIKAAAVRGNGTIALTVATYDYAEGALLWHADLVSKDMHGAVVVAMDWGAYKYLVNRAVPVVYRPTQHHLDVCCLRRWRMVPWRATNDVKVCRRCALGQLWQLETAVWECV